MHTFSLLGEIYAIEKEQSWMGERIWRGVSPEEEIPIVLVLSLYENTECYGGNRACLFSSFSLPEDGARHFIKQQMPGDCVFPDNHK